GGHDCRQRGLPFCCRNISCEYETVRWPAPRRRASRCGGSPLRLGFLVSTCAAAAGIFVLATTPAAAEEAVAGAPIGFLGVPLDFLLFALTLVGVAIFHRHTLAIGLAGLAAILLYKLAF